MIGIIDLKIGNVKSVNWALNHLGVKNIISSNPEDLKDCSKLILPGVGFFSTGMKQISELGFDSFLEDQVINQKKPILGICLGMQLFTKYSEETTNGETTEGLGYVDGYVTKIKVTSKDIRVPHVGWNEVIDSDLKLLNNIQDRTDFYFVHSYMVNLDDESIKASFTEHGQKIVACYEHDNIYGAQFHPEKSQKNGLQLLRNFAELC